MKEEGISADGTVIEACGNATFRVQLDNGHELLATICGQMKQHNIKVITNDRVIVEISPYDLSRGRIKYRYK